MIIQTGYRGIVKDFPHSEPYIAGTRVTVSSVARSLGRGKVNGNLEKFVELYPHGYLTKEKILSALEYYKNNGREIDSYIAESRHNAGKVLRTR